MSRHIYEHSRFSRHSATSGASTVYAGFSVRPNASNLSTSLPAQLPIFVTVSAKSAVGKQMTHSPESRRVELIEQKCVGRHQFDAIEAGLHSALCGRYEVVRDATYFVCGQDSRHTRCYRTCLAWLLRFIWRRKSSVQYSDGNDESAID